MIAPRHIDPIGLKPGNLDVCLPILIGPIKASVAGAVYTKATFASTINATVAVGTQPDFARNLLYQFSLTNGSASSGLISAGTVIVNGFDARGSALSETVALTALASMSVASQGVAKFASLASDGISYSSFQLATSLSSASNSVSFSIGVGNVVGLPNPLGFNGGVKYAYEGTSAFTNFTVVTGPVGTAGVSVTPTLGSGSNLMFVVQVNGADFRGTY